MKYQELMKIKLFMFALMGTLASQQYAMTQTSTDASAPATSNAPMALDNVADECRLTSNSPASTPGDSTAMAGGQAAPATVPSH